MTVLCICHPKYPEKWKIPLNKRFCHESTTWVEFSTGKYGIARVNYEYSKDLVKICARSKNSDKKPDWGGLESAWGDKSALDNCWSGHYTSRDTGQRAGPKLTEISSLDAIYPNIQLPLCTNWTLSDQLVTFKWSTFLKVYLLPSKWEVYERHVKSPVYAAIRTQLNC